MIGSELGRLLTDLGLTEYEAKALGTLFNLREADAPQISRTAEVPKTRVYDVLDRLMKKSLIIEIYGRPKKYRVGEINAVFDKLVGKKHDELKALEKRADTLKDTIVAENGFSKIGERVMKVKDRGDFFRILAQEIRTAKKSVHGFGDIVNDHQSLGSAIKDTSSKDVDIKLISKVVGQQANSLLREYTDSGIDVRDFSHGIRAYVIDGKKTILGLNNFDEEKPEYHFMIWEDNRTIMSALMMYFNDCWQKGNRPE